MDTTAGTATAVPGAAAAPRRYALSFTAGALLTREAALLAPVYAGQRDWERVRAQAVNENLLQARTRRTAARLASETVRRLSTLDDGEASLLTGATASERAHLMWAAACRSYDIIGEFAEDVLREQFLLYAPKLEYRDFDRFALAKALWHEELDEISGSTLQRLRSNLFTMLREAGLLSPDGHITPALPSERVTAALSARTPSDLRYFPIRQI